MKKVALGIVYWILQCTWGILETIIGLFVALFMVCLGCKPKRVGYTWYFETDKFKNFGGLSLGTTIVVGKYNAPCVLWHEYGHTIQNCIFGPFKLFVVSVFSVVRYWMREYYGTNKQDAITFVQSIVAGVAAIMLFTGMMMLINHYVNAWFFVLMSLSIYLLIIDAYTLWEEHKYNKLGQMTDYDSAWFEGTATKFGTKALN